MSQWPHMGLQEGARLLGGQELSLVGQARSCTSPNTVRVMSPKLALCIRCDERRHRGRMSARSVVWTQQLGCHIKPPKRPRPSDVRPDLGIGDLGEQPIEDEELQEPQDPERSDVGSDNQDRTSEVLQMMAHGKVVRQG